MEKRLFIAIFLSLAVMLVFSSLMPKQDNVKTVVPVVSPSGQSVFPQQGTSSVVADSVDVGKELPLTIKTLETDALEVVFIEPYGAIKEVVFKQFQNHRFLLNNAFLLGEEKYVFKTDVFSPGMVVFSFKNNQISVIKRFVFSKANDAIDLSITFRNLSNLGLTLKIPMMIAAFDFSKDPGNKNMQDFSASVSERIKFYDARKDADIKTAKFIAARDKYFALLVSSANTFDGYVRKVNNNEGNAGVFLGDFILNPGEEKNLDYRIYLGPQDLRRISKVNSNWAGIVNYGSFDIISQVLIKLLEILFAVVHNWGIAIIILSVIIYCVLYPFSIKQMRSMKEMQALQPKIEELRKTYKDNAQQLNKEIMELYREHKVSPFGGCLPMLLQMPVFFALYQAMMRSIALKGAQFLWIKDLSEPDRLLSFGRNLPLIGEYFNILPILMAGLMFFQQKSTMGASGSANNEQQKMMMILFPIMFGFIFYNMPAGLVLYWFVNSILTLMQQLKMSRK